MSFGHLRIASVAPLNPENIVLAIVLNPELPQRGATLWTSGVYLNMPAFPSQKIVFYNQVEAFPKCPKPNCTHHGSYGRFLRIPESWRVS